MRWLAALLLIAAGPPDPALDRLFTDLRNAPSEQVAALLEGAIQSTWAKQGTGAVQLLMQRGARDLDAGDDQAATTDFTDALALEPGLTAAWHGRALARAHAGDDRGAIADLHGALAAEPRQFAALRTLSVIAERRQEWKGALQAWEAMLALDPKAPGGVAHRRDLERRALGDTL